MHSFRSLVVRVRGLIRRDRVRDELDEELRFHLEMEAEHQRARGLSPSDARRAARVAFGGFERFREETHAASTAAAVDDLVQSIRMALRRLRRTPVFSIAATLTLAVTIGATASVFGVVDGVLFKTFPLHDVDRVVVIDQNNPGRQLLHFSMSPANYLDYRAQVRAFTALAAGERGSGTVTGAHEPERVTVTVVTPSFFSVVGITPTLGRAFAQDSGGPAEVLLSYGYWVRRFGAAASVLGQKLVLDDKPFTIVGVTPAGVPGEAELWTRLSFAPGDLVHRDWDVLTVYGRLKDGATGDEAERDVEMIARRLASAYPQTNANWSAETVPLLDLVVGPIRPALIMLLLAAGCVLLIGVANLANLFLVRCLARERELAVRMALGASRGRLVGELLVEAATLALAAGTIGIGVAIAGVRILRALAPATLPRLDQVGVDGRVVIFCGLTSVATVLLFGALPAWQASRGSLANAMKQGARGTHSPKRYRIQDGLVVLQVAVALILLTNTGLLVESFDHFRRTDLGFRSDGVMTARVALPQTRYTTPEREGAFAAGAVAQLAALPGVEVAAASSALPGTAGIRWAFTLVGDPTSDYSHAPTARPVFVTADFFRAMGIALRRGRGVRATDSRGTAKVAVIDERMAQRNFANRDPIGSRLAMISGPDEDTVEIVGVAAAVKQGGLVAEDVPWVYLALDQAPIVGAVHDVVIRTGGDPVAQTAAIARTIAGIDATVPVFDAQTMNARVAQSVDLTRFSTFLASLFTVVALILGVVGIYSVLTYIVSQRQREIAIRLALGASHTHVIGGVLWRALVLTSLGIALGAAAAWWLTRALAGLFEGVSPHDPVVFVGGAVVFAVVALAAAAVPALRSTRVNPVVALTAI